MINKWETERYEKIACSLVGQCADEKLTVEESRFVIELALQEVNQRCNAAQVSCLPCPLTADTNSRMH